MLINFGGVDRSNNARRQASSQANSSRTAAAGQSTLNLGEEGTRALFVGPATWGDNFYCNRKLSEVRNHTVCNCRVVTDTR